MLHQIPLSFILDQVLNLLLNFYSYFKGSWYKSEAQCYFPPIEIWLGREDHQNSKRYVESIVIYSKGNWDDYLPLIEFAYHKNTMLLIKWIYSKPQLGYLGLSKFYPRSYGEGSNDPSEIERYSKSLKIIYRCQEERNKFAIGDWVLLKVSPMNGVMRIRTKGKLSPRYIGLYKILMFIVNVDL